VERLFSMLCLGVLSILLLLHFFISPIKLSGFESKIGPLTMVALCTASVCLLLSNFLFRKRVKSIGSNEINSENINDYRGAYILRWALLEGAILVNVIIYFFAEKHPALIVVALLLLLLLFVSKPKLN